MAAHCILYNILIAYIHWTTKCAAMVMHHSWYERLWVQLWAVDVLPTARKKGVVLVDGCWVVLTRMVVRWCHDHDVMFFWWGGCSQVSYLCVTLHTQLGIQLDKLHFTKLKTGEWSFSHLSMSIDSMNCNNRRPDDIEMESPGWPSTNGKSV